LICPSPLQAKSTYELGDAYYCILLGSRINIEHIPHRECQLAPYTSFHGLITKNDAYIVTCSHQNHYQYKFHLKNEQVEKNTTIVSLASPLCIVCMWLWLKENHLACNVLAMHRMKTPIGEWFTRRGGKHILHKAMWSQVYLFLKWNLP